MDAIEKVAGIRRRAEIEYSVVQQLKSAAVGAARVITSKTSIKPD